MKHFFSLTREELRKDFNKEPYRADQLLNWVYKHFQTDFEKMSNLPKGLRQELSSMYSFWSLELITTLKAEDAIKFLFKTKDGLKIESVLIFEKDHTTLCVSSQVGCAIGCRFCATAKDGLLRNLQPHEIVEQYMQVSILTGERARNVVFMGMGEPLANYESVRKAAQILVSSWGLDLSKRRISISTSGLIAQIKKMSNDPLMRDLNLAVSINAPNQSLRLNLMPISQTNTLNDLFQALYDYPLSKGRRIMLEYVLISGLNDSPKHALELLPYILKKPGKFKVNLIPYNEEPGSNFKRPPMERILAFQEVLTSHHVMTHIRFSKGKDILGACGQLRSAYNPSLCG
ncbi:MAG: 23S rRNA (adenine(2503)-C(2))-methyltransferase RlmN [Aquificaceae bacterium]|nr:23S rRNA (adenine(2503)-C(2))-methyltransferase RlmN [Aquificaceae bacterium]